MDLLAHKTRDFRPRIARLTVHLDLAGLYALMLWPYGRADAPPEPLIVVPPTIVDPAAPARDMNAWYYVFTIAVELAQAVIVEANYGEGLLAEIGRIDALGLRNRLLFFDVNDEIYRADDNRRWRLSEVGEAVRAVSPAIGTYSGT